MKKREDDILVDSKRPIIAGMLTTIVCTMLAVLILNGCNRTVLDTSYTFKKAIIEGIGTVEVDSWCDYEDSDMVQVKAKDGTVYLTHSSKVILMSK